MKDPKVLFVSASDKKGGAAIAAYRLFKGIEESGTRIKMLVQDKITDDPGVIGPEGFAGIAMGKLRPYLDRLPLRFYRKYKGRPFDIGWFPSGTVKRISGINPDIVHLHWVAGGMLHISELGKIRKPIVWTLHDMWPFTGGCHHSGACRGYRSDCASCPALGGHSFWNMIAKGMWKKKRDAFRHLDLTVISPSRWLAAKAKESSLLKGARIHVIPNGIDSRIFKPIDKDLARTVLGLPKSKKLLLFGTWDIFRNHKKGYHLLEKALRSVRRHNMELVLYGETPQEQLPLRTHAFGRVHDPYTLALLFSAADVFCTPSMEENLPSTVIEAMMCGTPVLAFSVGGIPDMIDHMKDGYLAEPFDTNDLMRGLDWILASDLSRDCRKKGLKYDIRRIARRYLRIYRSL